MNVPMGWKLVPLQLTERMQEAAFDAIPIDMSDSSDPDDEYQRLYSAMLAAAPEPPGPQFLSSNAEPPECETVVDEAFDEAITPRVSPTAP